MDDLAVLRKRIDGLARRIDAGPNGGRPGAAVRAGKVIDGGSKPSATPGFFLLKPQRIGGAESEGSSPTTADDGPPFVSLVVGDRVPAVGDVLVSRLIGGRWVAQTRQAAGGGTIAIPGCTCPSVPATLALMVNSAAYSAYKIQPATLSYMASPAWATAARGFQANEFWSTSSLPELLPTATTPIATGFVYYHMLRCLGGNFVLYRAWQTSMFASQPWFESVYAWPISAPSTVRHIAQTAS